MHELLDRHKKIKADLEEAQNKYEAEIYLLKEDAIAEGYYLNSNNELKKDTIVNVKIERVCTRNNLTNVSMNFYLACDQISDIQYDEFISRIKNKDNSGIVKDWANYDIKDFSSKLINKGKLSKDYGGDYSYLYYTYHDNDGEALRGTIFAVFKTSISNIDGIKNKKWINSYGDFKSDDWERTVHLTNTFFNIEF